MRILYLHAQFAKSIRTKCYPQLVQAFGQRGHIEQKGKRLPHWQFYRLRSIYLSRRPHIATAQV
jgi:hypothetical protein